MPLETCSAAVMIPSVCNAIFDAARSDARRSEGSSGSTFKDPALHGRGTILNNKGPQHMALPEIIAPLWTPLHKIKPQNQYHPAEIKTTLRVISKHFWMERGFEIYL